MWNVSQPEKKPYKKNLPEVMRATSLKNLSWYCHADIPTLFNATGGNHNDEYAFKDNGSKILAVAHCDVSRIIEKQRHFSVAKLTTDTLIYSTYLDDRLGVYTILEVLPRLGINVDVLLTTDEEIAKSTATLFTPKKEYNWMVEFDRRGDDAVTYQYDWEDIIGDYFQVGTGTFSDLNDLDHVGVCGVNVGVGYQDEHSPFCYMSVAEYRHQLARFVSFWDYEKDNRYEHFEQASPTLLNDIPSVDITDDGCVTCPRCASHFNVADLYEWHKWLCCPMCGEDIVETKEHLGNRVIDDWDEIWEL